MRESRAGRNGCKPISTANIMASRCRSTIGRRLAITTFVIFRSTPTEENGVIAKVGQSIPKLILCGLCMSGVTRFLQTRSRFDLQTPRPRHASLSNIPVSDGFGALGRVGAGQLSHVTHFHYGMEGVIVMGD